MTLVSDSSAARVATVEIATAKSSSISDGKIAPLSTWPSSEPQTVQARDLTATPLPRLT